MPSFCNEGDWRGDTLSGDVVVVGGEPAALSCVARLLREGVGVVHIYPVPWGLSGASRDIGLAYPELGEPLERLEYAIGPELAAEFHAWGKRGVELLSELAAAGAGLRRGSRLLLSRHEQEARVVASDALERQRLGDEVRLMSGGAASNYAPLSTSVHQASFETHVLAFAPASLCESLQQKFIEQPGYRAVELTLETWQHILVESFSGGVRVQLPQGGVRAEVAVVAAAYDTGRLLGRFQKVLLPLLGQAFCTQPLREKSRSSVVGLTASWGFERYRFDSERRLLACGIDPSAGQCQKEAIVLEDVQERFWGRACTLFSDLAQADADVLRWGVLFTASCDGLPVLGPLPGEPRLQVAAGFSTSAWSRGVTAGDAIAGQLLGHRAEVSALLGRCSPRRFV